MEILCVIYSDYKACVIRDNRGINKLLLHCQNSLYGTMVASILYYYKFTKSLTSIGFDINPYDPWIYNKAIDGSQMTICFQIDDWNMIHRKRKANDRMIEWLCQDYESILYDRSGKMSVIRGKVHEYLWSTLYYTILCQSRITMFSYIEDILTAFDEADPKEKGTKSSAAPKTFLW